MSVQSPSSAPDGRGTESSDRPLPLAERLSQSTAARALGEGLQEFVLMLYRHVPEVDLRHADTEDLVYGARSMLELARVREPLTPRVRVFNPDADVHGWTSPDTVVEIVNDDMPFLVDSVTALLNRLDAPTQLVIHPILTVARDERGQLQQWCETSNLVAEDGGQESWMQIRVRRQSGARLAGLGDEIERVLGYVRDCVDDWQAMRARVQELIRELEETPPPVDSSDIDEAVAFLRWLDDDHFTFLGAREYQFAGDGDQAVGVVVADRGLGLLRDQGFTVFEGMRHLGRLPAEVRHFVRAPSLIRITKANTISPVHRATHLDSISIKQFDEQGRPVGENMLVGQFASAVYTERVGNVPILRRKVASTLANADFQPGSHNAKTLVHILETYPRDELFQLSQTEVDHLARGVLEVYVRQRVALFARVDPFERFASCLVFVPREEYDTRLRRRFEAILEEAFAGKMATHYTQISDQPLGRIHFIIKTTPGSVPEVDFHDLENALARAAESWISQLESALVDCFGEEAAAEELRLFRDAFPESYQDASVFDDVIGDIGAIHRLRDCHEPTLRVQLGNLEERTVVLKIFTEERLPPLSEVLPVLENMGLLVLFERSYRIQEAESSVPVWLREMTVRPTRHARVEEVDEELLRNFEETYRAVRRGDIENDGFNRLVLFAGLRTSQANVLRAYARFLAQTRVPFSSTTVHNVLARRPWLSRLLWQLFAARFDPDLEYREQGENREALVAGLTAQIVRRLDRIRSLEEDRVVRRLLNAINSTLRTNYYQRGAEGAAKPYLALKLDSRSLVELPSPRPWREIWVYSPLSEGLHLRGGPIARGGIRWSDRREDFRTEVLGLMKAQRVKNAVIVPEGSKGGFVVRRPGGTTKAKRLQGVHAYRLLIRGLLDLTDNVRDGEVEPPARTVCWDRADTYLVVAADKGTASFSDTANEISAEYGYWLGDAFASGGSAGYDHKRMGITARGAWESVKRHFRELGKDIQSEPFTVVGVGDMSGDVFGNGMLQSPTTRLIGAFNHLHLFLDPDPDTAASYAERRRLFEEPGSTWADYDRSLISAGGGIFDRSAKSIAISPEIAALLAVEEQEMLPADLIRALLRAPADLLWLAGIGTYIKARDEADEAVGDRANDALRIEAREVGATVIGEGANLGLTQRGRVECALLGKRLNTDFIDNSAGVDCSDHEVNLKILLDRVVASGRMTRDQRDACLREMEDEVSELVLRANYLQPQTITVTQQLGLRISERLARVISELDRGGVVERALESLPSGDEIDERRRREQPLLVRPELAVLLSYAKIDLKRALLASQHPDDPALRVVLQGYFPKRLQSDFAGDILRHPLGHEIIATELANEIVNRVGLAFADEVSGKTGRSKADVALAYFAARNILDLPRDWQAIEELDNRIPAFTQAAMLTECGRLIESCTVWILNHTFGALEVTPLVESYGPRFAALRANLPRLVSSPLAEQISAETARLEEEGVPPALAGRVAQMRPLTSAFDIVRIASRHRLDVGSTASTYFEAGSRLGFDWLRQSARSLVPQGVWARLAVRAAIDDLFTHQAVITELIIGWQESEGISGEENGGAAVVERWLSSHRDSVSKVDQLLVEMRSSTVDLAMLEVANRALGSMARGPL